MKGNVAKQRGGGDLSEKLDKSNPTGTGAVSINRKSGSNVGKNSATLGTSCEASAENAIGTGNYSRATAKHTFAGGLQTEARHDRGATFGKNTKTTTIDQLVCGRYNDTGIKSSLFAIGYGTDDNNRKTALNAGEDGIVSIYKMLKTFGAATEDEDAVNLGTLTNILADYALQSDVSSELVRKEINFSNKRLTNGQRVTIKPGMIFLVQGKCTVNYRKVDTGDNISQPSNSFCIGFCTEAGKSDTGVSNQYRMGLFWNTENYLSNPVGIKISLLSANSTDNYIECTESSSGAAYMFYVNKGESY